MGTLFFIIGFFSFIAILVFGGLWIAATGKKNEENKKKFKKFTTISAGAWILSTIFFVVSAVSETDTTEQKDQAVAVSGEVENKPEKKESKKELTEEEKAEQEAKKKEEEAKKKEEEERLKKEEEEKAKKAEEERIAKEKAEAERKAKEEEEAKALAEQQEKEVTERKANAQPIPYAQLKKNPDRYAGEYVKYTGEIAQILEGDGVTNIRLSVTKTSYGYDISDIIFIEYVGYTDFVDGDIVTVYGMIYGNYSYVSQAGYNISLPGVIAFEIE